MKGSLRALLSVLTLALLLAGICACRAEEEPDYEFPEEGFVMTARITAIGERIEVEVVKSEYISGPVWVITNEETPILDEDGKKTDISALGAGDLIKIAYSGQVMMSYPAQIVGLAIQMVSE